MFKAAIKGAQGSESVLTVPASTYIAFYKKSNEGFTQEDHSKLERDFKSKMYRM
jgi:hypothetical protein